MHILSVEIENFKAIDKVRLDLHPTFNVLVGANGSGKSSVLQALHWMFQSGRNQKVEANAQDKGATLSERDAIYMPSPDYRQVGHHSEYGNNHGKPQMNVNVTAKDVGDEAVTARMWIKAARNEGISVHVPSNNYITAVIRDRSREFSAYIPGLAGIPLVEEKKSKLLVHRSAAAGDANTVLRNMLVLLQQQPFGSGTALDEVERLVAKVMGNFAVSVDFDENRHTRVQATFSAEEEGKSGALRPLELAGIGYLQVLQIFAYLVYFRPVILLVDEPDAHLYPVVQERLVDVLSQAAIDYGAQIVLSTHSPSIIRALPDESKVIWMKQGDVQSSTSSAVRQLMGWGLLDRKILLITEDTDIAMLRSLLSQWPELERATAIWPVHSSSKLPTPESLEGLRELVGSGVKIVVHRDRDFFMPDEAKRFAQPFEDKKHHVWLTKHTDIEAYWLDVSVVAAHFEIDLAEANGLIFEAFSDTQINDESIKKLRSKRQEILRPWSQDNKLPSYGEDAVIAEYGKDGEQFAVLGKTMMKKLREKAIEKGLPGANTFGHSVPVGLGVNMAEDLGQTLRRVV